jgi:hypothetical protein
MRYKIALILAASIGATASAYTPTAEAAGVYVGIGLPVPAYARPVVAVVPAAGIFYGPAPYYGAGYYFGGYRRYGHGYYGYARPRFGYRRWGYHWR